MGKLKRGNWSTHELERLRSLYPRSSEESVARLLRRSVPSVHRKARKIFGGRPTSRAWTGEDDLALREGFGGADLTSLCLVLGRTVRDVNSRVHRFRTQLRGGLRWEPQELGLLKKLFGSRSDEDLMVCLSRSLPDILEKAAGLCLSKDKGFLARARTAKLPMPRWHDLEICLLQKLYPTQSNLELARRLNRSVASVANKANQLGLKKGTSILRDMGRRNVSARYRRLGEPAGEGF